MGLDITVGGLVRNTGVDDQWVHLVRTQLDVANELLQKHGYAPYHTATDPEVLDNRCPNNHFRYSAIHFLRRAYARHLLYPEKPFEPVPDGANATDDDALRIVRQRGVSHLVCHSDTDGMYIPHDFLPILFVGRRLEGEIGSSRRLMEELQFVAPAIGIRLDDGHLSDDEVERLRNFYLKHERIYTTESGINFFLAPTEQSVWFSLYEAARLSIKHGIFIWFC